MALTYGSKGQLPGLSPREIAYEAGKTWRPKEEGLTWKDWSLIALETIGAGLMFAPLGLVAGTAVYGGLAASELTLESYDPKTGEWTAPSAKNIGLTVGAVLAPAGMHMGFKGISALSKGIDNLRYWNFARGKNAEAMDILKTAANLPAAEINANARFYEKLLNYQKGYSEATFNPFRPNRKIVTSTISTLEAERLATMSAQREFWANRINVNTSPNNMFTRLHNIALESSAQEIRQLTVELTHLREIVASNSRFGGIGSIREIKKEQRRRNATELIEDVRQVLGDRYVGLFDTLLKDLRYASGAEIRFQLRRFFKSLDPAVANRVRSMMENVFDNRVRAMRIMASDSPSRVRNLWKRINSAKFYNNEVQMIQNINGADAGRWLAETGYHKIKERISRWIERKQFKWLGKLFKAYQTEEQLQNEFLRAGGVSLNSRYLYGYRILFTTGVGKFATHTCIMKFRKAATKSMSGKNVNGKQDVIFKATNHDLKMLVKEGSAYWFRVGAAKGWFMSRGGRPAENTILGKASTVLSFIPIQAIRSLGSIISNVKAVIKNFSQGFNEGMNSYLDELQHAFKGTALNRAGRMLATTIIGGSIAKMGFRRAGWWVGRVLQQTSSATISAYGSYSRQKRGKNSFASYFKKNMGKVATTRIRSDVFRGARHHNRSSIGVQRRTATRKGQITQSIFGSGTGRSKGWFNGW